jgi:hypothetical protein
MAAAPMMTRTIATRKNEYLKNMVWVFQGCKGLCLLETHVHRQGSAVGCWVYYLASESYRQSSVSFWGSSCRLVQALSVRLAVPWQSGVGHLHEPAAAPCAAFVMKSLFCLKCSVTCCQWRHLQDVV